MTHQKPQHLQATPAGTVQPRVTLSAVLVVLLFTFVTGCQRNPAAEQKPPFAETYHPTEVDAFYQMYQNETSGDELFKGKKIQIDSHLAEPFKIQADALGNKYISFYISAKKKGEREDIRCYLLHPDNPTVGPSTVYGWDIRGICIGKVKGVITLRDCYLTAAHREDADW